MSVNTRNVGNGNKTLSFYATVDAPVLQKRKWWDVFGRDTIRMQPYLYRFVYADINDETARHITKLLYHGLVPTQCRQPTNVQIEQGTFPPAYIQTAAREEE